MDRFLCLSLALLFLANVIPSGAQSAEAAETRVTVAEGAPLAVECQLRPEQRTEWRRDGGALPAGLRAEPELPAPDGRRLAARLSAPAAAPRHSGLYTCTPERDRRVRVLVQPAAPAAPPAGEAPATEAAEAARAGDAAEVVFELRGKTNFSLLCTLPKEDSADYIWKKNDTLLEQVHDLQGRYKLEEGGARLTVPRGLEDDFGNYSCALAAGGEQRWAVRGNPYAKLPENTNVVEGQKLKIVCKVVGKPYPRVTWWVRNSSDENGNYTEVRAALGARAELQRSEQGVPDGVLLLGAAHRADAGRYNCTPGAAGAAGAAGQHGSTVLRVKDMYAALWPFLGICAEVFVLCAIILVYEKRRTKPELDDSDTDNHDQKKS